MNRPTPEDTRMKPYDRAMRELVAQDPLAFVHLLGLPYANVEPMDGKLPGQSILADAVLRITESDGYQYLLHIEFQASRDSKLRWRVLDYNARLAALYEMGVLSVVVLLRREADASDLTGEISFPNPTIRERAMLYLSYEVVRVWTLSVAEILRGDPALLPFAPLTDEAAANPVAVVEQVRLRLDRDVPAQTDREILKNTTQTLLGLRYDRDTYGVLAERLREMKGIEESLFIQDLLQEGWTRGHLAGIEEGRNLGRDEGRMEGELQTARTMVLRMARRRLGEPEADNVEALNRIQSLELLEALGERLLQVESWNEMGLR